MAQFTEALKIKPDYAEAHYELGTVYLAMGDRNSALREYEILKSKNPGLAEALYRGIK
jgi:tetratricopeptide (TPR) repeat protein